MLRSTREPLLVAYVILYESILWTSAGVAAEECRSDVRGLDYTGSISTTVTGRTCQAWIANSPQTIPSYRSSQFPDASKAAAQNFCRNPTSDSGGPWCFTTDPSVAWERCDIPYCYGIIDYIEPKYIGWGGGTRVTIHGRGFARNQFNFGSNSTLGNQVFLVNAYEQHACPVFKENSNQETIVCFSPVLLQDTWWSVRLVVDGVTSPNAGLCGNNPDGYNCKVNTYYWYTPRIQSVWPQSGTPDTVITLKGLIFSDRYGSNLESASNGNLQQLLRVYVGGQNCELKNGDNFYGLALDNSASNWGTVSCKIKSTFVTSSNVTFLVESPFGQSIADSTVYGISATNELYMFQSYAVIDSVSPASGSTAGGQLITITGQFFDDTTFPASVQVGGRDCIVQSLGDSEITCLTPAQVTSAASYPGNRGIQFDLFNSSVLDFNNLQNLSSLSKYGVPQRTIMVDELGFCQNPSDTTCAITEDINNFMARGRGYFTPSRTGSYSFFLMADDIAILYLSTSDSAQNKVMIANVSRYTPDYYRYPSQASPRVSLVAENRYYLEILMRDYTYSANVYVAAAFYDTDLIQTQPGVVVGEMQEIAIDSVQNSENQTITLANFQTAGGTQEKQKVIFTHTDTSAVFRLGLYGVFTDLLNVDTTSSKLQSALNDLSTLYPERVTVSESVITNGKEFTITFNSELGDWPLIDYRDDKNCTLSVQQVTQGVPSFVNWRLSLVREGVTLISDLLPTAPTAIQISGAITSLFSARCPPSVTNPGSVKYLQPYDGVRDVFSGTLDFINEPYCGRSSVRNPGFLFDDRLLQTPADLTFFGFTCFAYRGAIKPTLKLMLMSSSSAYQEFNSAYPFNADGIWHYTCIDLKAMAATLLPGQSGFFLRELSVSGEMNGQFWIDDFYLGGKKTTTFPDDMDLRRIPLPVTLNKVEVYQNGSSYRVGLIPYNCAFEFDLLTVLNADKLSGNTGYSSSSVSWGGGAWPSDVSVKVNRLLSAAQPVTGTFDLSYKGANLTQLSVDLSASELEQRLRLLAGLNEVTITRIDSCYGNHYQVQFTQSAGDQPTIVVDGSALHGNNVTVSVKSADGHIFFNPVPGDLLRTLESSPQVSVTINGIASRCRGQCGYAWSPDVTPTVTSVSPTSGHATTVVTISGAGFSSSPSDNNVTFGGAQCNVTLSSASQIKCTALAGPLGSQPVLVTVNGKGLANGTATFTYQAEITDIQPRSGSLGGGTTISISGSGFASETIVRVGSNRCEISSINYALIVCATPPGSAGTTAVSLNISGTGVNSPQNFTYDSSVTPSVNSFIRHQASVAGGDTLVITGQRLGATTSVTLISSDAMYELTVNSSSNTQVVTYLPLSLRPGNYSLRVFSPGIGFATVSGGATLAVVLLVSAVGPTRGSFEGGTEVMVIGQGFLNNQTSVNIGNVSCDIIQLNYNNLTCLTPPGVKTYTVTNGGTDPRYGLGYAWSPDYIQISAGDSIRWIWTSPPFVTQTQFKVEQTPDIDSKYNNSGFASGAASSNGYFVHRFDVPGEFYYWSGMVDPSQTLMFRGKVKVLPKASYAASVTVTVAGQSAVMDSSSALTASVSVAGCSYTTAAKSGCVEAGGLSVSRYQFVYAICHTPEVTGQNVVIGNLETPITLSGTGFSTNKCANDVKIGDFACDVSSSTATEIVCSPNPLAQPDVGIAYPLQLTVRNRGDAYYVSDSKTMTFIPSIASVSPNGGSLNGGTRITIVGSGFRDSKVSVTFGSGQGCPVLSVDYKKIVCVTGPAPAGVTDVRVSVTNQLGAIVSSQCVGSCNFTYSAVLTPTVTAPATPMRFTYSSNLLINGTNFGTRASSVMVMIGPYTFNATSVSDTQVACTVGPMVVATYSLMVYVEGKGYSSSISVSSDPKTDSISPSFGSINGGQEVTITGNGFNQSNVIVAFAVAASKFNCTVKYADVSKVICTTTGPGAAAAALVGVKSPVTFANLQYNYSVASTPTVTAISPTAGVEGAVLTITGTGFSTNSTEITVLIGSAVCAVTASSLTDLTCVAGGNNAGPSPVKVNIRSKGQATSVVTFNYQIAADSITPSSGSFGGSQLLTLRGRGFTAQTQIYICDTLCNVTQVFPTNLTCSSPNRTPDMSKGIMACDVRVVASASVQANMTQAFTFRLDKTPEVLNVSPRRGGTMGGTRITINGTKFGANGENSVAVNGVICDIITESSTSIVCETNASPSVKTNVELIVAHNGQAPLINTDYWYIDRWSSNYTWGDNPPPAEGDFVVISPGQLILLDESTPTLKMLLIQGGELVFDEVDLTLRAENILISSGGRLTVGTEETPFQHNAVIEMHGFLRSPELPIYGAKCLAVREGELNLHGKPVRMTWTRLGATVPANATSITLEFGQLDWPVGGEIVIATTGHKLSQGQTEKRVITAISGDGKTLTLDRALLFTHLGETVNLGGGYSLEMRAEVGLLTRNVKVVGTRDMQWADNIPACAAGFNPGEFATQTCFQGRFGDEIGSDQFGAQIMFHAPVKDKKQAVGKLSYIEVNYAGQAFRLGRYPVHFHMNGDMSGSYVRGISIHESFNRAVNIHATHNVLVEHTVIYNIMGGAFFLEDGIETGNVHQYNLALFVKASSSLLNDDITPAAFWATNPNNTYFHNAVAGGTHFGFWYRLKEHPDGPSATTSICPRLVPLGPFFNNSVHSNGWFAVWTFDTYTPMKGGQCGATDPEPAIFRRLISWNNEKGAEWVNAGALQLHDSLLANNELTGLEVKLTVALGDVVPYTDSGPLVTNTVIVSYVPAHPPASAFRRGITLPWSAGFLVKNTTFINFDSTSSAALGMTSIQGHCTVLCGGFNYYFRGLNFVNGNQNLGIFRWQYDGVFYDLDGSLTGTVNGKALAYMETLDPAKCKQDNRFSRGVSGVVCDATTSFARWAWNNPLPRSLAAKNVILINEFGAQLVPYATKRLTHTFGWMSVVELGGNYKVVWEDLEHMTNISYNAGFYGVGDGGVVLRHNISEQPHRFQVIQGKVNDLTAASPSPLNYDANVFGDFYFDGNNKEISYIITNKVTPGMRKRRSVPVDIPVQAVSLSAYRCFWPDCIPPADPNTLPPITRRPADFVWWSNTSIWEGNTLPADGQDVTIMSGLWVVADITLPIMGALKIFGSLELDNGKNPGTGSYREFTLQADFIIIMGGRLVVGWEDDRFLGNVNIILTGTQNTPTYTGVMGAPIGQKAIACYGGLDLHGQQRGYVVSKLADTAQAGSRTIVVSDAVDWRAGEEVMITSTSYNAWQTETFSLVAVSGKILTLNASLTYKHLGESLQSETGRTFTLAADVALLSRNIKVLGSSHSDMVRLGFGGRVLVSATTDDSGKSFTGYARISFTQFINMGQLGYTEAYDPRQAISFVQTGVVSSIKPSYLKANALHYGFSPAIGMYGATGLLIQDNIIHRVVGGGLVVTGDNHTIERNLVALNIWTGAYEDRFEVKNTFYEAAYELVDAGTITFRDNVAAGSERAGFRIHGEPCEGSTIQTPAWSGNKVYGSMFGVMMWPGDSRYSTCNKIQGFTAWKNFDYGIYSQLYTSIEISDCVLIENGVSVWTLIIGPASLSHERGGKSLTIKNSYISGPTPFFDCITDVIDNSDANWQLSGVARSWRVDGGLVGLSMGNFDSGSNAIPTHPFIGRMAYPAIDGKVIVQDSTFANFKTRQCGLSSITDRMISSDPDADDLSHPMFMKRLTLESTVSEEGKAYYHISNVKKVNPSDCVDMDCDGQKKCLIVDLDGSLLGANGTILDDAAYMWNGPDPRYGLGDYRIPYAQLVAPNETRLSVSAVAPYKGLIRDNGCRWLNSSQAWICHSYQYDMLVIESMDADTETRRLSPISVKSDTGFIDLLNGPQDHGWCSGYTCQKRISTFWAVVAVGHHYDIYMTSTNPQHTRFYLLNSDINKSIRIAVYYSSPMRLDVFFDGVYIYPTNAQITSDGNYNLKVPTTSDEFVPPLTASGGQNYFDRTWQLQYIILRGSNMADVIVKEVVVVSLSLPPMTVDEFFGSGIVNNLATFLGIPANKIRVTKIVRESTAGKRSTGSLNVQFEIGDAPVSGANVTQVNNGSLTRTELVNITRTVVGALQTDTLPSVLNTTILSMSVTEPLPLPQNSTNSSWASLPAAGKVEIQVPQRMELAVVPAADRDMQPFPTQPAFAMYDNQDHLVQVLGSRADPWKIQATLVGIGGFLIGQTTCGFVDGWCNFTNLGIGKTAAKQRYAISFQVVESSKFNASTSVDVLRDALLVPGYHRMAATSVSSARFGVQVDIRDQSSDLVVPNIAWRGEMWTATLSLYNPLMSPVGALLNGTLMKAFNASSGLAAFDDLSLDKPGRYALLVIVTSSTGITINRRSAVIEITANVTKQRADATYSTIIKINSDYDTYAAGSEDIVEAATYNYLMNMDATLSYHDFSITRGSIYVAFSVTGTILGTQQAISAIADSVKAQFVLALPAGNVSVDKYLQVDGQFYDGLRGTSLTTTESGPGKADLVNNGLVIGLVVGLGGPLLIILVVVVIIKLKKKTGGKVHSDEPETSSTATGGHAPAPPTVTRVNVTTSSEPRNPARKDVV